MFPTYKGPALQQHCYHLLVVRDMKLSRNFTFVNKKQEKMVPRSEQKETVPGYHKASLLNRLNNKKLHKYFFSPIYSKSLSIKYYSSHRPMTFIMHFSLDMDIDKGSKKNYLPRRSSVEDTKELSPLVSGNRGQG